MPRFTRVRIRDAVTLLLTALLPMAANADVDFADKARTILAENCIDCHGPDKEQRKAKLRLDLLEGATKDLGGYQAIMPGKPDQSELIARLVTDDKDDLMPPKKTGKSLTKQEIEVLRQWIGAGAAYPVHWAYRPIQPPPPPKTKHEKRVSNAIDRYVFSKLEKARQSPSPEADRRTLAKRLHYDLLGLPPDPARVDAFVNDQSPDAYSKLVDELLQSPHFGERWGRHWLDMARYADSDGYSHDAGRSMWPYRDWVIDATNRDLSFDRFVIEQLAGDMLPDATLPQRIATGFHRNTQINTEGGVDKEQFRVDSIFDRIATTGEVMFGLTLGCAQCHDHKFDPISQVEYYRLFAFFNNADEPRIEAPTAEVLAKRESRSYANAGIVQVRSRGINQDGKVVIDFTRSVMIYKKGHAPHDDFFPAVEEG